MVTWNKLGFLVYITFYFPILQAKHAAKSQAQSEHPSIGMIKTKGGSINPDERVSSDKVTKSAAQSKTSTRTVIATENSTTSSEEFNQENGDSGSLEISISVPVVGILIVAGTVGINVLICRKRRTIIICNKCVRYKNKKENDNLHLYRVAVNNTHDCNSLKEEKDFKCSTETVSALSPNLYDEINVGSMESIDELGKVYSTVSKYSSVSKCSSVSKYSMVSIGPDNDQSETDTTEANDSYDTLQSNPKAKSITTKTKDGFKPAYDHVITDKHTKLVSATGGYSHLGVEMNGLQQSHFKVLDNDTITADIRFSRMSANYGADQSLHEYVILEPDGHYIVHE